MVAANHVIVFGFIMYIPLAVGLVLYSSYVIRCRRDRIGSLTAHIHHQSRKWVSQPNQQSPWLPNGLPEPPIAIIAEWVDRTANLHDCRMGYTTGGYRLLGSKNCPVSTKCVKLTRATENIQQAWLHAIIGTCRITLCRCRRDTVLIFAR